MRPVLFVMLSILTAGGQITGEPNEKIRPIGLLRARRRWVKGLVFAARGSWKHWISGGRWAFGLNCNQGRSVTVLFWQF